MPSTKMAAILSRERCVNILYFAFIAQQLNTVLLDVLSIYQSNGITGLKIQSITEQRSLSQGKLLADIQFVLPNSMISSLKYDVCCFG